MNTCTMKMEHNRSNSDSKASCWHKQSYITEPHDYNIHTKHEAGPWYYLGLCSLPIIWKFRFLWDRDICSAYDHMSDEKSQQGVFVTVRFRLPNSVGIIVGLQLLHPIKPKVCVIFPPPAAVFTQNILWDVARQPVSLCHLSFFLLRGSLCGLSSRGTVALCSEEGNYYGKHWIAPAHKGQKREVDMAEWFCSAG